MLNTIFTFFFLFYLSLSLGLVLIFFPPFSNQRFILGYPLLREASSGARPPHHPLIVSLQTPASQKTISQALVTWTSHHFLLCSNFIFKFSVLGYLLLCLVPERKRKLSEQPPSLTAKVLATMHPGVINSCRQIIPPFLKEINEPDSPLLSF